MSDDVLHGLQCRRLTQDDSLSGVTVLERDLNYCIKNNYTRQVSFLLLHNHMCWLRCYECWKYNIILILCRLAYLFGAGELQSYRISFSTSGPFPSLIRCRELCRYWWWQLVLLFWFVRIILQTATINIIDNSQEIMQPSKCRSWFGKFELVQLIEKSCQCPLNGSVEGVWEWITQ